MTMLRLLTLHRAILYVLWVHVTYHQSRCVYNSEHASIFFCYTHHFR